MQLFRKLDYRVLAAALLLLTFTYIFPTFLSAAEKTKFVVVIDAGHGGNDHGAIENGVREKDINLAVAQKLGSLINKKLKDTEVVFTRSKDEFISLQKRADIANNAKADLFISIHCNSVDRNNKNRANVVGATTYVLGHHKDNDNLAVAQRENSVVELDANDASHFENFDPSSDESNIIFQMTQKKNFQNSIRFASDVQREMSEAGRVSRGVQQAGFWVLWSTAMPAALIELDFICNPEQAKFLDSKEGQDKLAGAIFNAVKKYETYYRISLGHQSAQKSDQKKKTSEKDNKKEASPRSEIVAAVSAVEDEVPSPETDIIDSNSDVEESFSANIPSATSPKSKREHRADQSAKKTSSASSHRRRSSASRELGSSRIEEVHIIMTEEVNAGSLAIDSDAKPQDDKLMASNSSKKNKKEDAGKRTSTKAKSKNKEKEEVSKPGRRDKDKKTGRKSVKKGVNVDYRILLFVSDEELKADDEAFQGLSPIASYRENNKYKYTYGESADRKDMEALMLQISGLFPEARIIKCYF